MAQQVPTNGFTVPPIPNQTPANPAPNPANAPAAPAPAQPRQQVPPIRPPAVQPPPAPPGQGEPEPTPAAGEGDSLAEAIAALTAALAPKEGETPPPSPEGDGASSVEDIPAPSYGDLNNFDVNELEDPVHRSMAYALLEGAPQGFDLNRALGLAIERGDPSLIDRAYIQEKCGKSAANKVNIAEGLVRAAQAEATRLAKAVHTAAGGEAQWKAAAAAFDKAAPKELKSVVAAMLESGMSDRVDAAAGLVVQFAKGKGLVTNENPRIQGGAAPAASQALSKAEFQTELNKLDPNARDYAEQRSALFSRRMVGKQLGK